MPIYRTSRISIFSLFLLFFAHSITHAQTEPSGEIDPIPGQLCPDWTISHIKYFKTTDIHISQLKGRWTVLDFWSKSCSGCIESFPKYNRWRDKYRDSVDFMLIGYQDQNNEIQPFYDALRKRMKLSFPVAFDSVIFHQLGIVSVPYVVIIDPSGIVRGITTYLSQPQFDSILKGKNVELYKVYTTHQPKPSYNMEGLFLISGNGGKDTAFAYRSVLARWSPDMPYFNPGSIFPNSSKFEALGLRLRMLYKYAYFGEYTIPFGDPLYGRVWPDPVAETKDSALFSDSATALPTSTNAWCYSLKIPQSRSSKYTLMSDMQRDLVTYFGYDVEIQTRQMPVRRLEATPEAKERLATKGGKPSWNVSNHLYKGLTLINSPVSTILDLLHEEFPDNIPLVDSTNIKGNIDIVIDTPILTESDIDQALQRNGLRLVKSEQLMKVMVIRDTKPDQQAILND
ncbi:TlpA family protein disulfide reductase [Dinghuibacter silviterrae]|uniref:Thiol-disulfide isomerase/thioredoxin n=1 Tax=Dinghuibacter silviterrae TaxID=1539049 RepID=A0A4R8DRL3_9BACT|nr:TlpA disulfide reductase family protein [Dinghuibacter silviterrae]TDX00476.1 thiol-disulfide isomerase/thioredoxin [Dinghuibacter silviterrae]